MKLGQELTTCAYDSSITQARVNDNQEDTGFLAVTVIDSTRTNPTPTVRLTAAASEPIYGVVATFNAASQRCGVITSGIVPVRKNGASEATDIALGIASVAAGSPPNDIGKVDVSATAGGGRGTVVGRTTGEILWVDLDVDANAV